MASSKLQAESPYLAGLAESPSHGAAMTPIGPEAGKPESAVAQDMQLIKLASVNESNRVKVERFPHSRPRADTTYFSPPGRPGGLAVVCPFFNEPRHELQVTLESLHQSFSYLNRTCEKWEDKPIHVVIILDGWYKADPTMIEYLKDLFPSGSLAQKDGTRTGCPGSQDLPWWERFDEFREEPSRDDLPVTFILENEYSAPCAVNPGAKVEKVVHLTAIIKIDNRRKHNSHEWFFGANGFGEVSQAEYLLCVDAFTILSETCLYHLVKMMDRNPDISAATGRQRVMNREQQGTNESIFSMGYFLRMVQLFDFEIANAVYNGAFSLAGFLPVIPGPCGLYRAADVLQDQVRNWYFEVVNEEPDQTGMVLGNLRIAEDRVLTYASVLKTHQVRRIALSTLAVFYFEAELSLKRFVLQRRRWINGSIAGYIWLLLKAPSHLWIHWNANPIRKLYVWMLLVSLLMVYVGVALSPGYMILLFNSSVRYLSEVLLERTVEQSELITYVATGVAGLLYVTHVTLHRTSKFVQWLFNALTLLSVVIMVTSLTALLHYIIFVSRNEILLLSSERGTAIAASIVVFSVPFLLSLTISGRGHSFIYMCQSVIQYTLFSPMLIAWFGSYSFARTWDLSWGNRPVDQLEDVNETIRDKIQRAFKAKATRLTAMLVLINAGLFFVPIAYTLRTLTVLLSSVGFLMVFSLLYHFVSLVDKLKFMCKKLAMAGQEDEGEVQQWLLQNEHTIEAPFIESDSEMESDQREHSISSSRNPKREGEPSTSLEQLIHAPSGDGGNRWSLIGGSQLATKNQIMKSVGEAIDTVDLGGRFALEAATLAYLQDIERTNPSSPSHQKRRRFVEEVMDLWTYYQSHSEFVHKLLIIYQSVRTSDNMYRRFVRSVKRLNEIWWPFGRNYKGDAVRTGRYRKLEQLSSSESEQSDEFVESDVERYDELMPLKKYSGRRGTRGRGGGRNTRGQHRRQRSRGSYQQYNMTSMEPYHDKQHPDTWSENYLTSDYPHQQHPQTKGYPTKDDSSQSFTTREEYTPRVPASIHSEPAYVIPNQESCLRPGTAPAVQPIPGLLKPPMNLIPGGRTQQRHEMRSPGVSETDHLQGQVIASSVVEGLLDRVIQTSHSNANLHQSLSIPPCPTSSTSSGDSQPGRTVAPAAEMSSNEEGGEMIVASIIEDMVDNAILNATQAAIDRSFDALCVSDSDGELSISTTGEGHHSDHDGAMNIHVSISEGDYLEPPQILETEEVETASATTAVSTMRILRAYESPDEDDDGYSSLSSLDQAQMLHPTPIQQWSGQWQTPTNSLATSQALSGTRSRDRLSTPSMDLVN